MSKRIDGGRIAGICGRFFRLKEESKVIIGLHTLADMAAEAQRKASDREWIEWIEGNTVLDPNCSSKCSIHGGERLLSKEKWQAKRQEIEGGN